MPPLSNPWRLRAVAETGLLDTPDEAAFDRLTSLAATAAQAPMALLSLISDTRQFVKSNHGLPAAMLPARNLPVEHTLCGLIVGDNQLRLVPHRTDDPVMELWPFAGTETQAYAGVPLRDDQNRVVGVLAVLDTKPRAWTDAQATALTHVAQQTWTEIRRSQLVNEVERCNLAKAAVFESITDGFYVLDPEWRYSFANQQAADYAGLRGEQLIGRSFWDVNPQARGSVFHHEFERARRDNVPVEVEAYFEPRGRWFSVRAFPGVEGLAVFYRDVTQKHQAEAELREAERLKLDAMSRMAGAIAHDVNNLLTSVQGVTELLLAGEIADSLRTDVEHIRQASARSAQMADKLLAFSRRQVMEPERVDLADLVRNSIEPWHDLEQSGVRLEVSLATEPLHVEIDRRKFEQVIAVLMDNAREAMPRGGALSVVTRAVDLGQDDASRLELEPGPYVELVVADTGHGISPDHMRRIFEPFFSTKTERTPTTGLGLSMAQGIVMQCQGRILCESEVGIGTTCRVLLPRLEAQVIQRPAPSRSVSETTPRQATLLLAEDDPIIRRLATAMLRKRGYEVLDAGNGIEAEALFRDHPEVSMLVTDVVMPKVGGLELAERLRELRADLPVLFLSGYSEEAIGGHLRPGSTAFLQKPYTSDSLASAVHGMLATRKG